METRYHPCSCFQEKESHLLEKGGPEGAIYNCSKSGWINEELLIVWLKHFTEHAKAMKGDPILLILDNQSSHRQIHVYIFCPPKKKRYSCTLHTTTYNPLYAPTRYHLLWPSEKCLQQKIRLLHEEPLPSNVMPYELKGIFNKEYIRVATTEKNAYGFSSTGVYPLDPCKFSNNDSALDAGLIQQPTRITHNAESDEKQPINKLKKQQQTSQSQPVQRKQFLNFQWQPFRGACCSCPYHITYN
jgi:transposase-like protein